MSGCLFILPVQISRQQALHTNLHLLELENHAEVFKTAISEFFESKAEWTFSHKINGRWENTYLPIQKVPAAKQILNLATRAASRVFGKSLVCVQGVEHLIKDSFWFNVMEKGQSTGWHNHKAKAQASGVCYLQIPNNSGEFQYRDNEGIVYQHIPQSGTILLFPSNLNHSVKNSHSDDVRLSLAFNLYTLPLNLDPEDDPFGGNLFF